MKQMCMFVSCHANGGCEIAFCLKERLLEHLKILERTKPHSIRLRVCAAAAAARLNKQVSPQSQNNLLKI